MGKPFVSYIIASFNHEQFIERSLRSIINQTVSDIEIFLVDDGSSDRTYDLAKAIGTADARITLVSAPHEGVVAARNRAINLSTAPLVSVIDSDDIIPFDRTERFLEVFEKFPHCVLAFGDAALIDQDDQVIGSFWRNYPPKKGEFSASLFSSYCFVPAVAVMFRRSAFDKSGQFWGPGPNCDYLKWIELGLVGEVVRINGAPLGSWRLHRNNTSRSEQDCVVARYENLKMGLEELLQRNSKLKSMLSQRVINRRISRCLFMGGVNAALQRKWAVAIDAFKRAYLNYRSPIYIFAMLSCLWPIRLLSVYALSIFLKVKAPILLLREKEI